MAMALDESGIVSATPLQDGHAGPRTHTRWHGWVLRNLTEHFHGHECRFLELLVQALSWLRLTESVDSAVDEVDGEGEAHHVVAIAQVAKKALIRHRLERAGVQGFGTRSCEVCLQDPMRAHHLVGHRTHQARIGLQRLLVAAVNRPSEFKVQHICQLGWRGCVGVGACRNVDAGTAASDQ
jgi:hypothetical protein